MDPRGVMMACMVVGAHVYPVAAVWHSTCGRVEKSKCSRVVSQDPGLAVEEDCH